MRTAVICHATQDAAFTHELRAFLELNCPLAVFDEEGLIQDAEDLVDAAQRAISADVALVLLSPESVPKTWRRERWEPVLLDQPREFRTQVAFLLLRECRFPELLRRKGFFDLSQHRLIGLRSLKRWLQAQERPFQNTIELPERAPAHELTLESMDELQRCLADRPGWETGIDPETALAFAQASRLDFEGVFWIIRGIHFTQVGATYCGRCR